MPMRVFDIQTGRGLVEQHEVGLDRQTASDQHPLALAAGKRVDEAVAQGADVAILQGRLDGRAIGPAFTLESASVRVSAHRHDFFDGEGEIEASRLAEGRRCAARFRALTGCRSDAGRAEQNRQKSAISRRARAAMCSCRCHSGRRWPAILQARSAGRMPSRMERSPRWTATELASSRFISGRPLAGGASAGQ